MAIFTNQATLTYRNTVTNSNIATGEILEAISATKTAVTEQYTPGEDITYAISVINTGTTVITGLTVSDDLGAYTLGTQTYVPLSYVDGSVRLFVNGILQAAPTVSTTDGLVFSGITLPAGGNALILYEAIPTEFAPPTVDGSITNTASITGSGISTAVEASETVPVSVGADLAITKSISPSVVTENSRVTYSFVIQNFGNEDATADGGAVVTDTFDPILQDLVVTYNGTTWTQGNQYTYNEATGLFTTNPGEITVPAATFTQDPATGAWVATPGVATLVVVGTI